MMDAHVQSAGNDAQRSIEIPPPPPLETRWRRGLRAMRELLDDPDDTAKAVDFFYAIGRPEFERNFQRFATSRAGRALLRDRPSLRAAMSDRTALAALPDGSFGRAYLAFLERTGFQALALLDLQRQVEARWDAEEGVPRLDPVRAWFRERYLLAHDLYHVLTDYGTDDVGEAALLGFTLAQAPGRSQAILTLGATLKVTQARGWRWMHYAMQAWRRGRAAAWLPMTPWEELLPLRLDTVRLLLGIVAPGDAHPAGVPVSTLPAESRRQRARETGASQASSPSSRG